MTQQASPPSQLPKDAGSAVESLLARLHGHYPDMSAWTVISLTGRGRDFLHQQIHTRIGGLLPAVLSFDDYRTRRIAEATGRAALAAEDALLRFHGLLCREKGRSLPPADSQRLLSFLATIAEWSVTYEELQSLDRIGPEQLSRIDSFFTLLETFRSLLAGEGLFYPPFEADRFAELKPAVGELFFGLPLMTLANQGFFRHIPRDRLFADAPLFGPFMPQEPPEYETSLSLVRRLGILERRGDGAGLVFSELTERPGLAALLAREIDVFLGVPRSAGEQLFIVPLDERLSFYLWQIIFRHLGGQVNFAPWLPFIHFAAAQRLREAIRGGKGLAAVRRELVVELSSRWNELGEADRSACEGAIALCDELERLRPLAADHWPALADYLISVKKLRLHGRRSAPIQVVGLGDATGIPFDHAVILPMNSGIFPSKPFSGPYLNLIHLPRLYKTQYESDDLALRQFLAFGRSAHIAALYDQASGLAPSPYFAFLQTEFGCKAVKRRVKAWSFLAAEGEPALENTDEIRRKLREPWSFSSLQRFFTCPYRFILEEVHGVEPPPCFTDKEEHASLLIGNFFHQFFGSLTRHTPAIEKWRDCFDEYWQRELSAKLPDATVHKAICQSYLADIAQWEKEAGQPLLFSDEILASELVLTAHFGAGRYRLLGRIDRLQWQGDRLLIADLKYKEKQKFSPKRLTDLVDSPDVFDDRFQLLIYAYLALRNERATPDRLAAAYLFLRPRERGDYEAYLNDEDLACLDKTMERIAERLDRLIALARFTPNYRAESICRYCAHKALCLKPDLYRAGGRPW